MELESSRDISGQIEVEDEEIGFSVDVNWGAPGTLFIHHQE